MTTGRILAVLIVASLVAIERAPAVRAQSAAAPDFSGVYYPVNPFGPPAGAARAGGARLAAPVRPLPVCAPRARGPLPPPTRSAPVSDGRYGRPDDAPKLTAEYLAKWEVMRKSRMSGSSDYDPIARCLSAGMPSMMRMDYGMELLQTKDKIAIYGELNDMYRRIYLDARKPSQKVLDDPTYAGYSTARWEGDTLVVDTVAVRDDTLLDSFSPHSDQMTVRERIRFTSPGDSRGSSHRHRSQGLVQPYERTYTYRKASRRTTSCASSRAPKESSR
jgi:hypothetical protein